MFKLLFSLLCVLHGPLLFAQAEQTPFQTMMAMAKIKKVITVKTVAGNAQLLLASRSEDPAFVFTYAPGGDGTLIVRTGADETPIYKGR